PSFASFPGTIASQHSTPYPLNLTKSLKNVEKLQEGIAEQEYVVIIGRIEAALSEGTGAPLMRVSRDMGMAVTMVRDAIWKYHNQLEEILHESNVGI
ncbi:hypothetical protein NR402_16940, partial [Acidithiobacillus ferrooxidans]|nr:hypothetical protein [Acidithiobacillus ferrooxidans]